MKYFLILCIIAFSIDLTAQEQKPEILSPEIQIATALLAAPEEYRSEALVYGYDQEGNLMVLREGTNNLICLADDPNKEGVQVACYDKKLEPFMARGRALIAEGKSEAEKREIREQEAESGELQMPDAPSMLYVFSGDEDNYDRNTGEVTDGNLRYVIHIPNATPESTGLPASPDFPGMPWLMDPGTHRAHIMITPARKGS